jgi:predicted metalloendopeptidase
VHPAKTCFFVLAVVLRLVSGCLTAFARANTAAPAATVTPQLDHFDVTQVDRSLDPCVDFYQYTCKKWIAKNPIPPDQAKLVARRQTNALEPDGGARHSRKSVRRRSEAQSLRAEDRCPLRLLYERGRDQAADREIG